MSAETIDRRLLVSVVIPAHNAASTLGDQLDALHAQINAPSFEVLICDNNSTDGTAARALEWSGKLNLRIVDATGPGSASFARNRGAEAARSEVLLFCDADDLVGPTWVSALSQPLLTQENLLVAGALRHERFNPPDLRYAYDIPDDSPEERPSGDTAPPFAGYLASVTGSNFGASRRLYLSVGGMDASYPGGSEETDFSWRAQEAGGSVITAPLAVVHYRLRDSPSTIHRQQRIQQYARVLLWTRFRDKGMTGPSTFYSVREVINNVVPAVLTRNPRTKMRAHRILGGNLGALQGILVFRLLRRRPQSASEWWAHPEASDE